MRASAIGAVQPAATNAEPLWETVLGIALEVAVVGLILYALWRVWQWWWVRRRYRRARLPIDHWLSHPEQIRFGLPWPWRERHDHRPVVSAAGGRATGDLLAVVEAPRSDGAPVHVALWSEGSSFDPGARRRAVGRRVARLYPGRLTKVQPIRIGDCRGLLVEVETRSVLVVRIIVRKPATHRRSASVQWHHESLNIEFQAPRACAHQYRPHLETMIATLSWYWSSAAPRFA